MPRDEGTVNVSTGMGTAQNLDKKWRVNPPEILTLAPDGRERAQIFLRASARRRQGHSLRHRGERPKTIRLATEGDGYDLPHRGFENALSST